MGAEAPAPGASHAVETISAVIGDLEVARIAISADPHGGRAGVAAKLTVLAGELAELARVLQPS
jgi:hypothetical protein